MLYQENHVLHIETSTQIATMENGKITSLKSKATGKQYIETGCNEKGSLASGIQLLWVNGEKRGLDRGSCELKLLNEHRAMFVIHGWYGDAVITVRIDEESGDILVEPAGCSARQGVRSVVWELAGIDKEMYAVVPLNQGMKLKLDDPILTRKLYNWPHEWEIGLCVFESEAGDGFWVHCRDTKTIYKDIEFGKGEKAGTVWLHTQEHGPLNENKSAGGLIWRINCFEGGWRVPAKIYKDWYWETWNLQKALNKRPEWMRDIRLIQGAGDKRHLEALEKQGVNPKHVLIHYNDYRKAGFDMNYPEYDPSEKGAEYFRYAAEKGFHVATHVNGLYLSCAHPAFKKVMDFQHIQLGTMDNVTWSFDNNKCVGVEAPYGMFIRESLEKQNYSMLSAIHAGLSMWHCILYERVEKLLKEHPMDGIFLDCILNTWNLHNNFVENRCMVDGVRAMLEMFSESGVALGGEGLNEVTAPYLTFGQPVLPESHWTNIKGMERLGGDCAINMFIYGELCLIYPWGAVRYHAGPFFGQYHFTDEELALRNRVFADIGATPTFSAVTVEEILNPTPAMEKVLAQAR